MTQLQFPPKLVVQPDIVRDITTGARLSKMYGRDVGPADVAAVLNQAKLAYVLVGAHAANGYTATPRTTVDVDIVAQKPKQARDALAVAFPHLTIEEFPVVIRFKDAGHEAIDVIRPESSKLFKAVLKHTKTIKLGAVAVVVPTVEAVLAMKFGAMVTISRKLTDRVQDGVDFARVVEANPVLQESVLTQLGELAYPDGSKELLKLVADARAGRRLEF